MITFPFTLAWALIEKEEAVKEIRQEMLLETLPNCLNKGYEVLDGKKDKGRRQRFYRMVPEELTGSKWLWVVWF